MLDNADTKSSALNIFSFFWRHLLMLENTHTQISHVQHFLWDTAGGMREYFSIDIMFFSFPETILWVLKVLSSTFLWKHIISGKPTVMFSPTLWNDFLTQLLLHLILCQGPKGCQDYLSTRTGRENIVQSICPLPQYCQVVGLSGTSEIFSGSISRA